MGLNDLAFAASVSRERLIHIRSCDELLRFAGAVSYAAAAARDQ